jgi:hypothetical protein
MDKEKQQPKAPGVCVPWEEKLKELPPIVSREDLVKQTWQNIDGLAYVCAWHLVLSF